MSSSSRRSSRSQIPSSWRSPSASGSSPARISLVFASPEQGSPLALASTKLPRGRHGDTASLFEPMSKKRDRGSSISTQQSAATTDGVVMEGSGKRPRVSSNAPKAYASTDAPQSPNHSDGNCSPPNPLLEESQQPPLHNSKPVESSTVPFPSAASGTRGLSTNSSPGPSSWFGSLGRVKGREKMAKMIEERENVKTGETLDTKMAEDPLPKTQPQQPTAVEPLPSLQPPVESRPTTSVPAPINTTGILIESPPSQPQAIPSKQQPKRSWFSSSPTASLQRPPMSPPIPSTTSIPCSIDEEVPIRRQTPVSELSPNNSPPNTSPPLVQSGDGTGGRARLSSLNPSTSRFTLSIPLLGRPKVPLDQAVAVAKKEGVSKPVDQRESVGVATLTDNASMDSPAQLSEQIQPIATTSTSKPTELLSSSEPPEGAAEDPSHVSGAWWRYVAWGSSGNTDQLAPPISDPLLSQSPTSGGSATPTQRLQPPTPDVQSHAASMPDLPSTKQELKSMMEVDKTTVKPASVRSAESENSTWYTPWTWYSSQQAATEGGSVAQTSSGEPESVKTQSELVKEEALARDDGQQHPTPAVISKPSPANETNPIEASISSNRSGWASFFSSPSLVVKRVTGGDHLERDEHGTEVMNLDEDERASKGESSLPSSTATAISTGPGTGKNAPDMGTDTGKQVSEPPKKPLKNVQSPPSPKKPNQTDSNNKPSNDAPAPPLTNSDDIKRETANVNKRTASPSGSKKSGATTPTTPKPRPPNLVLPTWADTFHAPPRSLVPPQSTSTLTKTLKFVSDVLFSKDDDGVKGKSKAKEKYFRNFGKELPRAWDVLEQKPSMTTDVLKGCRKVVVIGVHGWFPGAVVRTVLGEPTGTSSKFVNMMVQALEEFQEKQGVKLHKITRIPLEGEGTIDKRLDKLYKSLLSNMEWMDDIHTADAILVATHSQGSIVSTHLLERLIQDKHIRTAQTVTPTLDAAEALAGGGVNAVPGVQSIPIAPQRICLLALCGIHLGPLRYLSSSSLLQPYIQYFESAAAKELFQFQNTESSVSKDYAKALRNVIGHGTKMVYVASLNDQVVPIYSGLFTAASHPLILRAMYIDGDAYHSSDFLSNLLVLLLRILNSGLSDSGLLAHLSEATAGSLNGVGHSAAYEELAVYSLAVNYLFLANDGLEDHPPLSIESFNATHEQNDYEIPWSLRDLIADERVAHFFSGEIAGLRDAFREWHPKTTILRDIKRKLQPIQRLPASFTAVPSRSVSKL